MAQDSPGELDRVLGVAARQLREALVETDRRGQRPARNPERAAPVPGRRRRGKRAGDSHELHAIRQREGRRLQRAAGKRIPILRRDRDPHGAPSAFFRLPAQPPARLGGIAHIRQAQGAARAQGRGGGPEQTRLAPRRQGSRLRHDRARRGRAQRVAAEPQASRAGLRGAGAGELRECAKRAGDPELGPLPPRLRSAEPVEQRPRASVRDAAAAREESLQEDRERLGRRSRRVRRGMWIVRRSRARRARQPETRPAAVQLDGRALEIVRREGEPVRGEERRGRRALEKERRTVLAISRDLRQRPSCDGPAGHAERVADPTELDCRRKRRVLELEKVEPPRRTAGGEREALRIEGHTLYCRDGAEDSRRTAIASRSRKKPG